MTPPDDDEAYDVGKSEVANESATPASSVVSMMGGKWAIGIFGLVRRAQLGRDILPDWSQWRDAGSVAWLRSRNLRSVLFDGGEQAKTL